MWFDTNPYEVGMGYDWMVDLEQASDFIGKEALAKIKEEGPKRQLVGVEIGGSELGSYNDGSMIDVFPVTRTAAASGRSPRPASRRSSRRTSASRWCRPSTPSSARSSRSSGPRRRSRAVVVPKPFVDPEKETPKQELTAAES